MSRLSRPGKQKLMPIKPVVRRTPVPTHAAGTQPLSHHTVQKVQEKGSLTSNDVMSLQRTMGNQAVQRLLNEDETPIAKPKGESVSRPLPTEVRTKMEQSFGTSFDNVRIHQGAQADAMNARAYTQGSQIHIQRSTNLNSYEGQKVLAHELAHVVQQRTGRVAANGPMINDDPHLETEAHRSAEKAANGASVSLTGGASTVQRAPANVIQRWPRFLKKMFGTTEEQREKKRAKKQQRKENRQQKKMEENKRRVNQDIYLEELETKMAQINNEQDPEFKALHREWMLLKMETGAWGI